MAYVITEACVDVRDRSCVDVCPVDCIYVGARKLYIHPDECIDCGACEPECPVDAIYFDQEIPDKWADYRDAEAEFFDGLGAPGGASKFGPRERDSAIVTALAPRMDAMPPRETPPLWRTILRVLNSGAKS